jgi:trimeric autotransporter adhesin
MRAAKRSALILGTVLLSSSIGSAVVMGSANAERFGCLNIRAGHDVGLNAPDMATRRGDAVADSGTLYFTARETADGRELWRSDGTSAGTLIVKDIRPGPKSSDVRRPTDVGKTLYFVADDGAHGAELWKSDGSRAGTVMVRDIRPGLEGSAPAGLTDVEGVLYFVADDGPHGAELWRNDGTSSGTVMIKNIGPGSQGSAIAELMNVEGTVYFVADSAGGWALWKSDGTGAGTITVSDVAGRIVASVAGTLYLVADDGIHGRELWESDGTATGTVMVKDIRPGRATFNGGRGGQEFAVVGGTLYFTASSDHVACDDWVDELWKTDGTSAGTVLVKELDGANSDPFSLIPVDDVLYLGNTAQLWKTDGTSVGTVDVEPEPVSAFYPSLGWGRPSDVGGVVFLGAQDDTHGLELWKTDGTSAGTVLVSDTRSGPKSSSPHYLTDVGGTVYFVADDGAQGYELWKSDGSAAGTVIVKDIWPGSSSSRPRGLLDILD